MTNSRNTNDLENITSEIKMNLSKPLRTPRLMLRNLSAQDASQTYLSWLRDPDVNKHLEVRFANRMDLSDVVSFIESANASLDTILLGIFLKEGGTHIGNVKLGPIVVPHARSEIGFLIGDKGCWGNGYASEAIRSISYYGLEELGLEKITAGCYETNIGSTKALLKAGFSYEARISNHVVSDGVRVASLIYGLHL